MPIDLRAPTVAASVSQPAPAPVLRVAIFDRRPVVAEGLGALLDGAGDVEIAAVGRTTRDVARVIASPRIDVVIVGITPDDVPAAGRIFARLAQRPPVDRPRLVCVVSDEDHLADLFGSISITVITSQVGAETLREVVLSPSSGRMWALSRQLVQPSDAASAADPSSRVDALTEREHDVLRGIESGLSTKEIAVRLGITSNTVRTHAQRLMSKLAVHSRLQAAAYAAGDMRPRQGRG
jgi:DNA-binding NarL/FixJ family response regulator